MREPARESLLLLHALEAFVSEHRRCGELDGGLDHDRVSLTCSCGAQITHPSSDVTPPGRALGD